MGSYNSWCDEGDDDACSYDIHVKMMRWGDIVNAVMMMHAVIMFQ